MGGFMRHFFTTTPRAPILKQPLKTWLEEAKIENVTAILNYMSEKLEYEEHDLSNMQDQLSLHGLADYF